MKLNPDCIRDLLIYLEDKTYATGVVYVTPDSIALNPISQKYSFDEITYHAKQCYLSNLLTYVRFTMGEMFIVSDITPEGHKFLANIKSNDIWEETKLKGASVGSMALDVLTQIAANIITNKLGF